MQLNATGLGRSSGAILIFLLFSVPYIQPVHEVPIPSFYSEWASVFLALALLLVFSFKHFSWEPGQGYITHSAFALTLLAVLTALQSLAGMLIYPTAAITFAAVAVLGVAVSAVGVRLRRLGLSHHVLDVITAALIFAATANVAAAILQSFGWQISGLEISRIQPPNRLDGLIGQPNHLGTLCVMGIVALWWWSIRSPIGGMWCIPFAFLLALGVAGSASRIALVSLGATWIGVLIFSIRSGRGQLVKLGVAFIAVLFAFFVYGFLKPESVADAFRSDTVGVRLGYLSVAWELFKNNPFLGVGFENFAGQKFALDGVDLRNLTTTHSHNLFTHLMAEWGVLGLVSGAIFFVSWCVLARDALRLHSEEKALAALLVLVLWLHSSVEYPLWYIHWLVPYLFLVAVAGDRFFSVPSDLLTKKLLVVLWVVTFFISITALVDYRRIAQVTSRMESGGGLVIERGVRDDINKVAALTFYQAEADLLLARTLEVDPLFLDLKMQITDENLRYRPTPETIARRILFLVYVGADEEALGLLRKLEIGGLMHKRMVLSILDMYAVVYPDVLDEFLLDVSK